MLMSLKDGNRGSARARRGWENLGSLPQPWQLRVQRCKIFEGGEVFNQGDGFSLSLQLLRSQIRLPWWATTV